MPTVTLSDAALALLRQHAEQQGSIPVDDSTREPYRESAREGLMTVGHSFTGGRETFYALTETGKKLATVLDRHGVRSGEGRLAALGISLEGQDVRSCVAHHSLTAARSNSLHIQVPKSQPAT